MLMHPSDLPYFTKMHPGRVLQRQLLALHKPFSEASMLSGCASMYKYPGLHAMLGLLQEEAAML